MIAEIYFGFLFLTIIIIIAGKYINSPVLQISSFTILFILGIILLLGAVTYKTGSTDSYSYMCTVCGTPSNTTYLCTGNPNSCDTYDGMQETCILYGCTYNETDNLCYGTPYSCESYISSYVCGRVGCELIEITTNGTIGINATVISSVTHQNSYSNYDNEIVQGLTLHHLLGFLIAILGALGFISSLFNLKEDSGK